MVPQRSAIQRSSTRATPEPTFLNFRLLPTEIRYMIWEAALLPRIVSFYSRARRQKQCTRVWSNKAIDDESFFWSQDAIERFNCLSYHDITSDERFEARHGPTTTYIRSKQSTLPPPATLYACQESRKIALKRYERQFGTVEAPPSTWLDSQRDTLFLRQRHYLGLVGDIAQKVKHLAIMNPKNGFEHIWKNSERGDDNPVEYWFAALFVEFPCLESLTFVREDEKFVDGQEVVFGAPVAKDLAMVRVGNGPYCKGTYEAETMRICSTSWFRYVDRTELRARVGSDRYERIRKWCMEDRRPAYNLPQTVSFVQRRSNHCGLSRLHSIDR